MGGDVSAGSTAGGEVVDLSRPGLEAGIPTLIAGDPGHGLAEALLLGELVTGLIDGPLGVASLHLAGLAIAELFLLAQHPFEEGLAALAFIGGLGREGKQQGKQEQTTHREIYLTD